MTMYIYDHVCSWACNFRTMYIHDHVHSWPCTFMTIKFMTIYVHELVLSGPCPFMSMYSLTTPHLQLNRLIRQGWLTPEWIILPNRDQASCWVPWLVGWDHEAGGPMYTHDHVHAWPCTFMTMYIHDYVCSWACTFRAMYIYDHVHLWPCTFMTIKFMIMYSMFMSGYFQDHVHSWTSTGIH